MLKMVRRDVTWSQMQVGTAEKRIAFFAACQRVFETVRSVGPVSCQLDAAASDAPPRSRLAALDDVPTPVATTACVACAAPTTEAVVANPFSDWVVVLCPACR